MTDFSGRGFAAGDVRGTRAWKVDVDGRLRGITYEKIWRPGENTAECFRGIPPGVPGNVRGSAGGATVFFRGTAVPGGSGGGGSASFTSFGGQIVSSTPAPLRCSCGCGIIVGPQSREDFESMACSGIEPDCGCGFYGYQEGSNDYYSPGMGSTSKGAIGGVFRGYGKVVLGTRGFRAEKAEILALYVDSEMLTASNAKIADTLIRLRLEENYKVPVFGEYIDLLKAFPPDPPERSDDFWEAS